MLTNEDRKLIRGFAAGEESLRERAVEVFRAWLRSRRQGRDMDRSQWPVEMLFMSEADNVCPDPLLRSRYRKELLEGNDEV